jgi:alkylation response protein AidB-like acyl-CoA dehydrogenase
MIFELSPQDAAFRHEVRTFIRDNLPAEIARATYLAGCSDPELAEHHRRWQTILCNKGWGAPHWPAEFGGADWTPIQKHIFLEEIYHADAPDLGWQGLHMVAPVIIAFGSPAQKARFLPRILSGEDYWCQGFSEPNAGSDLANLRTSAQLDGDHYVLNGQKIWTSDATESPWGFFLVRTHPAEKPQRGISFLLVDMQTPGITIRRIPSIDGGIGLHEVFLENVRVPGENLVGEAGKGWTYAKYLLEKERTTSSFLYFNKRELEKAKEVARSELIDGVALINTPEFSRKLARVEMDLLALEWSVLRILAEEKSHYDANAVVSALKISGSEMQQRVTELQMAALGSRALRHFPYPDMKKAASCSTDAWPLHVIGKSERFLFARASTIYGGAHEIQKNIIAKLAFGL